MFTGVTEQDSGRFYYGWAVSIACTLIYAVVTLGGFFAALFFPMMAEELGFTAADLGVATSVYTWVLVISSVGVGYLVDRWGPRRVLLLGVPIASIGALALLTVTALWQAVLYFGIIFAVGQAMAYTGPCFVLVRRWFQKRAGLVTGLMLSACGVVIAVGAPFLVQTSTTIGWRNTLLWTAVAMEGLILVLAFLVIRNSPEDMGLHIDGLSDDEVRRMEDAASAHVVGLQSMSVSQSLRTSQLWLIAGGVGMLTIVAQGATQLTTVAALSVGIPAIESGSALTWWALALVISGIVGGMAGDRFGKRGTSVVVALCAAAVMTYGWLLANNPTNLYILMFLGGLLAPMPTVLYPGLLGDLFGIDNLGTILGVAGLLGGVIGGFGPLIGGMIASATGSLGLFWLICAICEVVMAVCYLLVRKTEIARQNEQVMGLSNATLQDARVDLR